MFRNHQTSRWEELMDSVLFHARLAHYACAPIKFVFINPYMRDLPDGQIVIDGGAESGAMLTKLQNVLNNGPFGGTPMCAAIKRVTDEIATFLPILQSRDQGISLCIGSDGRPTDGTEEQIINALRVLGRHKEVSLVFRLFTSVANVVAYWNNIDHAIPELTIDVLDDLLQEAREVAHNRNEFIAYGLPLHRLREFGTDIPAMDMLDERTVTAPEMRVIYHAL